jgi:U3 small nucleolar RNA-associated protein 22
MESAAKRRKLGHAGDGNFDLRDGGSSNASTASSFMLQAEELVGEVRMNYETAFEDADSSLHKLREAIDGVEPHGPLPVCLFLSKGSM